MYNVHSSHKVLMSNTAFMEAQKHKYRVTLELDVLGDFDPHNINWEKLFDLNPSENVKSYVEDLDYHW